LNTKTFQFEHHWAHIGNAYARLQSSSEVQEHENANLRLRVSTLEDENGRMKDECDDLKQKFEESRQETVAAKAEAAEANQREADAIEKVTKAEREELQQYKRAKTAEEKLAGMTVKIEEQVKEEVMDTEGS
jgi:chromosome segregation ATPase